MATSLTVKSGWKTTEFYIAILTSIGAITASLAGVLPSEYAVFATTISSVAYSISRGLVKK